MPFLGGTPRFFLANVASPISWAPDSQRIAFLRTRISPELSSQLFVADADGGQERELASQPDSAPVDLTGRSMATELPSGLVTDGELIAVAAAAPRGGRIVFVDSSTGSMHRNHNPQRTTSGLNWLDARSLVLNQPVLIVAPNQLFLQPYPAGPPSRLTNDPNDYVGVSLSGYHRSLVTGRRDARMYVWVSDGGAATESNVVQRVPSIRLSYRVGRRSAAVLGRRGCKARYPAGDARPKHS